MIGAVSLIVQSFGQQVTKNARNKEEAIGEILRRIQIVFNGQLVKDVSKIFLCINLLQSYILCIFSI